MPGFTVPVSCAGLVLLAIPSSLPQSKPVSAPASFPAAETLNYSIEWRLIYAGDARLTLEPKKSGDKTEWESKLHLESAVLVSKLYTLDYNYAAKIADAFCTRR